MRWTMVSIGEMAMIVNPRVVRRERFLANVASRCVTVRLPLFDNHPWAADTFHSMQIVELSREPLYIATNDKWR